ncbi:unnamed protein product [Enterobius vermicularis]|uniref:VWFA domain-containing protein n=1 Tax=Enterobius vermicularis TaxID=51028 RepID=A0A3P6HEU7_ENTVE|nr:unnamed protein product [Enterobius vermicularis]
MQAPFSLRYSAPVSTKLGAVLYLFIEGCLIDIIFLMDFSGGTEDKRSSYLKLASSLIQEAQLGPNATQVGMVRYSGPGRTDTVFHLNKHSNLTKLVQEMMGAPHMGGTTRTGEAILYAVEEFAERHGGRKNSNKILVVFTDGYSQDDPLEAAQTARKQGITIHVVAVDDEAVPPNREQLNEIAMNQKVGPIISPSS